MCHPCALWDSVEVLCATMEARIVMQKGAQRMDEGVLHSFSAPWGEIVSAGSQPGGPAPVGMNPKQHSNDDRLHTAGIMAISSHNINGHGLAGEQISLSKGIIAQRIFNQIPSVRK